MADQRVRYVIEAQNLLSKVLTDIEGQANKTDKAVANIGGGGVGGGGGGTGFMRSIVGGNLIADGIRRAAGAMKDFGMESVQSFSKFEQFGVALTTMFHGNKTQAQELSNTLVNFAKKTPFELTEIQDATRQLIAYGSSAGTVGDELKMLGDISAGVGAPIGEIAYLYGTARTQGRLFSRDIYQLSGRGIPIVEALARQFKVTKSAVMDLVEKGRVGFPEMQKALQSLTQEGGQFFNMMDAQSKTLGGQLSNMGDAWEQLKVHIGQSQEGILKRTVDWATQMISNLDDAVQRQNKISETLDKSGIEHNTSSGLSQFFFGKNKADQENSKLNSLQDNIDLYVKGITNLKQANHAFYVLQQMQHKVDIEEKVGGKTDLVDKERALLSQAFKDITDFRSNFWNNKAQSYLKAKEEDANNKQKTKLDSQKLGTGTTITAGAPQNMYISIGKLIETLKVERTDEASLPTAKIRAEVSKVLLEVVNDADKAIR